ncbi:uncharacterized protein involved in response to NO [Breoghania corrubedonensis]|uniref:Uncharacterized protein involved in response to NO n=1 Tax=Breoghania corrubedonensis TaxID=665038 RepID=A0A2T5V9X3_9HYPH|nr:NnrS family protein [Breoghania corrubedonensis]PTW60548.1 uncharacterized protein involved in response to NO [Breoghania corrubedonensis]
MIVPLKRLLGEGFRVFFLAAGLYGVFAILVWTGWLGIHAAGGSFADDPFAMPPHLWHAHEMIFGFPTAALGGFFLTAVPNWTGAKAARHLYIGAAAALWLAGRIAIWFSADLSPVFVAVVDLSFLPFLGMKIATQLVKRPKPQNMMFLGLLAIIWVGDWMIHLEWIGVTDDTAWAGFRVGLFGICAMIAVLGGRVTPAFTRNALMRKGQETALPVSRRWAEMTGVGGAILLPLALIVGMPETVTGGIALMTGAAQIVRLSGWRSVHTLGEPIVWALHAGFALLGTGYILFGLADLGIGSEIAALHVLGIGAVGGMTLAVMSRAALGHTGRPLVAPHAVAFAYALLPLAALLRWTASSLDFQWYYPGIFVSGALWIAAFALFVAALWPAFWSEKLRSGGA